MLLAPLLSHNFINTIFRHRHLQQCLYLPFLLTSRWAVLANLLPHRLGVVVCAAALRRFRFSPLLNLLGVEVP